MLLSGECNAQQALEQSDAGEKSFALIDRLPYLVQQNICSHEDWVCQESSADLLSALHTIFCSLPQPIDRSLLTNSHW